MVVPSEGQGGHKRCTRSGRHASRTVWSAEHLRRLRRGSRRSPVPRLNGLSGSRVEIGEGQTLVTHITTHTMSCSLRRSSTAAPLAGAKAASLADSLPEIREIPERPAALFWASLQIDPTRAHQGRPWAAKPRTSLRPPSSRSPREDGRENEHGFNRDRREQQHRGTSVPPVLGSTCVDERLLQSLPDLHHVRVRERDADHRPQPRTRRGRARPSRRRAPLNPHSEGRGSARCVTDFRAGARTVPGTP